MFLFFGRVVTKGELLIKSCVFLFLGVQNLKHSEATFTLFLFLLSLLVRVRGDSFEVLPNVMLLPCIRAPLNGQFNLLGYKRWPCVARGDYLGTQPFIAFQIVSLEAG